MEQNSANNQLSKQISDLSNVDRLITNTLNLITDIDIKGAYAKPVSEILDWLQSFKSTVGAQKAALEAALPKSENNAPTVKPDALEAKLDVPAISPLSAVEG